MEQHDKGSAKDLANYRIETARELLERIEAYCASRMNEA